MFPAKLKLTMDEKTHFCEPPQEAWERFECYKAGIPWNGQQRKSRGKQHHPNKKPQNSGAKTTLQRPTKKEADEEKEAALRASAELAIQHGSDREMGTNPKGMATDSDMEQSTQKEDEQLVVW
ncbi:hypothetical protein NDU88_010655 [Pleurodeles waltl]|uniref:Uncharacterized protein n=1 Tax=Pleurodeles waltl TaxID=8319 RepID=A0AAV7QYK1_PLEWA|nr:hypothetical protein NDU88_010655 [Pleurodeles waltl]